MYCLPILKREEHRVALVRAATSGNPKFFLGTDSAPHAVENKISPCGEWHKGAVDSVRGQSSCPDIKADEALSYGPINGYNIGGSITNAIQSAFASNSAGTRSLDRHELPYREQYRRREGVPK